MSKISLLSYPAGFCGEFLCNHIHQSKGYKDISYINNLNKVNNQYRYPSEELFNDFKFKVYTGHDVYDIPQSVIDCLEPGLNYCVPSHWTGEPAGSMLKFFNNFVKIDCTPNPYTIRKGYALWFLKSRIKMKEELLNIRYHDYKLWLLYDIIKQPDSYQHFDIDELVYGTRDRARFEDCLECTLGPELDDYANKNEMLLSRYNIDLASDEKFIKSINTLRKEIGDDCYD